jgi:hypothetical protein
MRALAFLASMLIAGPSFAQPILMELRDATLGCFDCMPVDMQITMRAEVGAGGAAWSQVITQSDIGRPFNLPADLLDDFDVLTSGADVYLDFWLDSIGPGGPTVMGYVPPGIFTNGSLINNPQVIRHAPVRGNGLSGYTISSITQTLNSLAVRQLSASVYNLTSMSTFRIYGAVVPEPSTLALLIIAQCLLGVRFPRL